jgi:DNA-binding response OmpR family regulator
MDNIVIYEGDDSMRALLKAWLVSAGYRVEVAAPDRPLRAAQPDLVLLSVYMPRQAGAQQVEPIAAAHPGVPLIAISGQCRSGLSDAGTAAHALGVVRILAKPLARGDLLDAVRAILGVRG